MSFTEHPDSNRAIHLQIAYLARFIHCSTSAFVGCFMVVAVVVLFVELGIE